KSFLSALAGIAIEEGAIGGPGDSVLVYFPEYVYEGMESRKNGITVRHLLTMRMGIGDEDETFERVIYSGNWIREIVRLPLVDDPGARFRYNTLQTHLLSGVLTKGAGESLLDFANGYLFGPMNISVAEWTRDPQGYCFGGGEMWFTPRNMAALGLLYLNGGSLGGEQIVPAAWVDSSLAPSWSGDVPGTGPLKNYNYGFLWWLGELGGHEIFMALGYAGQTVIVFPALEMIVVTTARTDTPAGADQETAILGIVADDIIAAVR
ncbi:MAG: beta-lactamase family protein, partial [Candidatus Krumholzibacteria bacterium]|nr:beta-lactamase family protein [Candidatus Krumholzibacteria bacterium]